MWYLLAYAGDTHERQRLWLSIPLPAFRTRFPSFGFVFVSVRSLDADERSDSQSPKLLRRFDEEQFADHLPAAFPWLYQDNVINIFCNFVRVA